ncbi:plastocyanin/azurin family copper-binding protein [Natrinema salinisoli]|uniref:plastocyanin/azurin family copper-binding protein n=1 Tax=Natrinema salinisoli TaxID=2878535 RepID=UPI001CF0A157|nr:plastocyanin/azurin family copper-binding protein [Natrinema salinisoli]
MTDHEMGIDDNGSSIEPNGDGTDGDGLRDRPRSVDSSRSRRTLLSTTASALAVGISGCLTNPWGPDSDDVSSDDAETATGGNSEETDPPSDPSENETDDGGGTDSDDTEITPPLEQAPSQVVEVAPDGFQFDPESFEIDAGETVHWIWMDSGHNLRVRAKPEGSDWKGTPGTASDTYDEGYEHGHTFEEPGEYRYYCAPHQTLGLEGSFTVR